MTEEIEKVGAFALQIGQEYARKAIFLRRPYPPSSTHTTRSKLGGLPNLPDEYDWPTGNCQDRSGQAPKRVPLHFLAQIDCAEMGNTDFGLPAEGLLYFFALIDETLEWIGLKDKSDYASVIYAPKVAHDTPTRTPPPGMIPLNGYNQWSYGVGLLWPDERAPTVYPEWPIEPYIAHSFPTSQQFSDFEEFAFDKGGFDDDTDIDFIEEWFEITIGLLQKQALDLALIERSQIKRRSGRKPGEVIRELILEDREFPAIGAILLDLACGLGHPAGCKLQSDSANVKEEDKPRFRSEENEARKWIKKASGLGLDNPVSETDRTDFRQWMMMVMENNIYPNGLVNPDLTKSLRAAFRKSIQRAVQSPNLWKHIPLELLDIMWDDHEPYNDQYHDDIHEGFEHKLHQIGGYFQSSQEPKPIEDTLIPLLHLNSDYGLNFMFADVGEIQFFIEPEDLKNRNFDRVQVVINGG